MSRTGGDLVNISCQDLDFVFQKGQGLYAMQCNTFSGSSKESHLIVRTEAIDM